MKKIIAILFCAILLVGCSDANANISNPKDVVISIGDKSITTEEIYRTMLAKGPAEIVLSEMLNIIFEQEVQLDDATIEEAKAQLEVIKSLYQDQFLTAIQSFGYTTEEEFFEKNILPAYQETALVKKYINENLQTIFTTYQPKKVRIAEFENEEKANEAFTQFNTGVKLEELVKSLGTTTYTGLDQVVYNQSSLPSELKAFINDATATSKVEAVIKVESSGKFYLAEVVEVDSSLFQDEAINVLAKDSTIADEALGYFIKKGNFKIYDKDIYNAFKAAYPDYIK